LTLDNHFFPTVDEDDRQVNDVHFDATPVKPREHFNNETQTIARHAR